MRMRLPIGWRRPGIIFLGLLILCYYGWLKVQLLSYDRQVRRLQQQLDQMRPDVLEAIHSQEQRATLEAQQQFAAALAATTIPWGVVLHQLAAALPPSLVLHTVVIDGPRVTLHGILRYPPPQPQEYLANVAGALKRQGVFRDVMVTVTPPAPDEPSVARVDLVGEVR